MGWSGWSDHASDKAGGESFDLFSAFVTIFCNHLHDHTIFTAAMHKIQARMLGYQVVLYRTVYYILDAKKI